MKGQKTDFRKALKLVKLSGKSMKVIKAGDATLSCTCRSCSGCDALSVRGVIEIPSGVWAMGGGGY